MGEEAEHRESERDRLDGIIRTKEAKLIELGPQLASILSSTVPVQDYLGMPLSDKREQISLDRLFSLPISTYSTDSPWPTAGPATRRSWSGSRGMGRKPESSGRPKERMKKVRRRVTGRSGEDAQVQECEGSGQGGQGVVSASLASGDGHQQRGG